MSPGLSECESLPNCLLMKSIAEGRKRRAHFKKGLARKLFGNVKNVATAFKLTSVAMLGVGSSESPPSHMNRAGCREVFLNLKKIRTWLLEWIKKHRAGLVIVACAYPLWSFSNMQYNTYNA